jgi:hypothetical protein
MAPEVTERRGGGKSFIATSAEHRFLLRPSHHDMKITIW